MDKTTEGTTPNCMSVSKTFYNCIIKKCGFIFQDEATQASCGAIFNFLRYPYFQTEEICWSH